MPISLNKVLLVGNVGKDPDVRYHSKTLVSCQLSLATDEGGYRTQDGREIPERTEWHRVVLWNDMARRAENVVKKGMKLYVEGRLRTREYIDKSEVTHYVTEVVADRFDVIAFPSAAPSQPNA